MQLVIEISKEYYKIRENIENGSVISKMILKKFKNGIPLPEGHGRLGDLSELENRISGFISRDKKIIDKKIVSREKFILDEIKDTLTIIEADKEDKDGD